MTRPVSTSPVHNSNKHQYKTPPNRFKKATAVASAATTAGRRIDSVAASLASKGCVQLEESERTGVVHKRLVYPSPIPWHGRWRCVGVCDGRRHWSNLRLNREGTQFAWSNTHILTCWRRAQFRRLALRLPPCRECVCVNERAWGEHMEALAGWRLGIFFRFLVLNLL